jgi:hypothetical protein
MKTQLEIFLKCSIGAIFLKKKKKKKKKHFGWTFENKVQF